MKFIQMTDDISSTSGISITSIINPAAQNIPTYAGALPSLTPLSINDPLYTYFVGMYEKINSDHNEEASVRLQISIVRSIYQNKVKYFTASKNSLIALSASDTMLKNKVKKIHKDTYSKLGVEFPMLNINCIRKMKDFVPAVWMVSPNTVFASWKLNNNAILSKELASVIATGTNLSAFAFTDEQVDYMSVEELNLVSKILTYSQNGTLTLKQIDEEDI